MELKLIVWKVSRASPLAGILRSPAPVLAEYGGQYHPAAKIQGIIRYRASTKIGTTAHPTPSICSPPAAHPLPLRCSPFSPTPWTPPSSRFRQPPPHTITRPNLRESLSNYRGSFAGPCDLINKTALCHRTSSSHVYVSCTCTSCRGGRGGRVGTHVVSVEEEVDEQEPDVGVFLGLGFYN